MPNLLQGFPKFSERFPPKPDSTVYDAAFAGASYTARGAAQTADAFYEVMVNGNVFVFVGSAAPSDDTGSRYARNTVALRGVVPAGEQVWVKRVGTTNVAGSISLWVV